MVLLCRVSFAFSHGKGAGVRPDRRRGLPALTSQKFEMCIDRLVVSRIGAKKRQMPPDRAKSRFAAEHELFGKPVSTPDQVRGGFFGIMP
jgi:hypothetical protein